MELPDFIEELQEKLNHLKNDKSFYCCGCYWQCDCKEYAAEDIQEILDRFLDEEVVEEEE